MAKASSAKTARYEPALETAGALCRRQRWQWCQCPTVATASLSSLLSIRLDCGVLHRSPHNGKHRRESQVLDKMCANGQAHQCAYLGGDTTRMAAEQALRCDHQSVSPTRVSLQLADHRYGEDRLCLPDSLSTLRASRSGAPMTEHAALFLPESLQQSGRCAERATRCRPLGARGNGDERPSRAIATSSAIQDPLAMRQNDRNLGCDGNERRLSWTSGANCVRPVLWEGKRAFGG